MFPTVPFHRYYLYLSVSLCTNLPYSCSQAMCSTCQKNPCDCLRFPNNRGEQSGTSTPPKRVRGKLFAMLWKVNHYNSDGEELVLRDHKCPSESIYTNP